ncbi:IS481 family transposase [Mycobacterium asiaticum]|uniref:Transposase n=1 Tax=Mycobacterium asiaticum TaxID=1790 RepID=A0A1A3MZT3_MYCAS|nr:IS481 family transposase [Mycobacterium asiaticum]OBK14314.1 transposase [Mycobacterium asiaticum]
MSKARLVITAVLVEGRSQSQVARDYGVSQGWVSRLLKRYTLEGPAAFEPRSRRPHTSPTRLAQSTIDLIIDIRQTLVSKGLDAGPHTIAWHLEHHHRLHVSVASISRHLAAAGLVAPSPHKRPKSSYIRFAAEQPNQRWQADFTHWRLANGTHVEILCWLDDHSRYALSVTAHHRITGPIVADEFIKTVAKHGIPYSTLTDNGMVFTTRFAGGKGGRNQYEAQLHRLGVHQINSTPNHPTTCGKVERFHQTLKKWLTGQPRATTLTQLQTQLDEFLNEYTHHRVRRDRIDHYAKLTLRHAGRLHHIGVGRTHARTHVLVLVQHLDIRIINAATGELLRQLTLDPTRDYQPRGVPAGRPKKKPEP